ncbi:MAG: sulfatase-like hydrolase/transferase, partial [Candidatus Latescibacteria bacterium]|nr:sulfatase-like hydrolase/transferase [Candidatus Latescibacterota bacterium]
FTSDHGDYLGDHGLWGKGLPTYECMQRVPFVVRHPRCETPGAKSKALQSLVDLEASFLDVAGLSAGINSQGICQTASWLHAEQHARDWALVEFRPSHGDFMQRTYVEGHYKLVRYENRAYGELYDLEADPHQFVNRFDDLALRNVRDEVMGRFDAHRFQEEIVRERMAVA